MNRQVRQYIESDVKRDTKSEAERREVVTQVIGQVQRTLPNASNVQHLGSNYEGNSTKDSSDYDATFNVAPSGSKFQAENISGQPGYSKLKPQGGVTPEFTKEYCTDDGYLSGKAIAQKMVQSSVDKLIGVQNGGGQLKVGDKTVDVKRSVTGPAVTLDMKWGTQQAQLDIVSSVDRSHVIGGKGSDYVPKPPGDTAPSSNDDRWRQSFAPEQKSTFQGIDAGNQVHREAIKTVKTVKANDGSMSGMPSYVVKTAALSLAHKDEQRIREGATPKSWDSAHTADRVQDIGKEIYKGLDRGEMRDVYNGAENILSRTTPEQRNQWKNAIGPDGGKLMDKIPGNQ